MTPKITNALTALRAGALVVRVQREQPGADAVVREQGAGVAGVLGGDDVGAAQRFQRAPGDVAEVPDGSGHHI